MAWTDLLPPFSDLLVHSIQDEGPHLTITLVSTRLSETCPTCQTYTQAGHGWFKRRVHSLPCSGRAVVFQIHARRFRCPNTACPRRTFREDLSSVAARYQRRTPAATRLLQSLGAEVGGQAGVRIATQMPLPTTRSTLLKTTKRLAPHASSAPRVVGVDDFAWKKGRRYDAPHNLAKTVIEFSVCILRAPLRERCGVAYKRAALQQDTRRERE